jgi:hypothetical protein
MSDLRTRLREIDRLEAPSEWESIALRPQTTSHVEERVERRSGASRLLVVLMAFLVFAGGGTLLWKVSRSAPAGAPPPTIGSSPSGILADVTGLRRPAGLPIALEYPDGWNVHTFRHPSHGPGQGYTLSMGARISNPMPPGYEDQLWLGYVVVTISAPQVEFGYRLDTPDTPRPLSMSNAQSVPGDQDARVLEAVVAGYPITIEVTSGPTASAQDRGLAGLIVATIRPSHAGSYLVRGISQMGEGPFSPDQYAMQNQWQDIVDHTLVQVWAGAHGIDGPHAGHGLVIVRVNAPWPNPTKHDSTWTNYEAPPGIGSLRITSTDGTRFILKSHGGPTFEFDRRTGVFRLVR